MERAARGTLDNLSVTTLHSLHQLVASLSGGQRQAVAIARAVLWNSKLIIMDEPTAALGVTQTKVVLDLVRRLAERGLAVIVVSHNMNDIFSVADRIAVLHMGRLAGLAPAEEMDPSLLIDLMANGRRTSKRILEAVASP
jgi:ABC-type sugar transport system ATPase subunit